MHVHTGTSGFSYPEWRGSFYPADLKAPDMLAAYAARLGAVEINNTFYRLPRATVLESWASQVGPDFRFVIKASRRITHFQRLQDAGDLTGILLAAVAALGDRLGALLFQLPPQMRADVPRLAAFLELLPPGTQAAFEFRHKSWDDPAVHALLAEHGCALCLADTDEAPDPELHVTADWGYLRLRRAAYDEQQLRTWAERLAATGWQRAFVFFKHEDGAVGPVLAQRLAAIAAGR